MEMSHRSPEVVGVAEHAERTLRSFLAISDDYAVLFLQGGASTQFSAVPAELARGAAPAPITSTPGSGPRKRSPRPGASVPSTWSASLRKLNFPPYRTRNCWQLDRQTRLTCTTRPMKRLAASSISGPQVEVPLVGDMSSTILSRRSTWSEFGVIYAGARKISALRA